MIFAPVPHLGRMKSSEMTDSVMAVFGRSQSVSQTVSVFDDTNFAERRGEESQSSDAASRSLRPSLPLARSSSLLGRCQMFLAARKVISRLWAREPLAPARLVARRRRQTRTALSKKPARSADELRHRSISGTEGRKTERAANMPRPAREARRDGATRRGARTGTNGRLPLRRHRH